MDEKTPLLRASDALSKEGARLLNLLGYKVKGLQANIGLEQELFLIPRSGQVYSRSTDIRSDDLPYLCLSLTCSLQPPRGPTDERPHGDGPHAAPRPGALRPLYAPPPPYIHTYTLTWSAVCCTADMAPPSIASPALSCMQEIQAQCFKLGIPLRTRHRGGCADLTRPLPNSSL